MKHDLNCPVETLHTLVVGSGAAGLNTACRLVREFEDLGIPDAAARVTLMTRRLGGGTSNNSGSDKQTYYKLGTGGEADRPEDFAQTLVAAGCAHGDHALIEGANSLRCFYRLTDLGVPFPHTATGRYPGYKTDHDPRQRGTSAGPWTSRHMVQGLRRDLKRLGVRVRNRMHLLGLVTTDDGGRRRVCGALTLDLEARSGADDGLRLFRCANVVMAGGGPGDLFATSVYPEGQMGPFAALLEAGVPARNLTEMQFGIASVQPRWNLSGTYQQVVPRYFSTDAQGNDQRDFLNPWFESMSQMATAIFLKGYQWPFDYNKVAGHGSSLIDIVVQREREQLGRRVYLDFRENPRPEPGWAPFRIGDLGDDAREYLERSGAVQATPISRLAHMNQPSIDLYRQMRVDLAAQPLEIGVCAQHMNGGFAVDSWWETEVRRLFVVGELAGTHGVKRPGGSALNAGQVGALRAAQRIARRCADTPPDADFVRLARPLLERFRRCLRAGPDALDAAQIRRAIQRRMSRYAGMVRSSANTRRGATEAEAEWKAILERGVQNHAADGLRVLEVRELALSQRAMFAALRDLLEQGGGSRGSYLVTDARGEAPHARLEDGWRFLPENKALRKVILTIKYDCAGDLFSSGRETPRPVPAEEAWFETAWAAYREGLVFTGREEAGERGSQ